MPQYLVTPSGHEGITFVASSGDDGLPNFPSESPNVLAVGGTDLYLTSSGAITSETAWTPTTSNGQVWSGGGGVSQEFSGQQGARRRLQRWRGDGRVLRHLRSGSRLGQHRRHRAGAPQWAALVAIADQGRAIAGLSTLNSASQTLAAYTRHLRPISMISPLVIRNINRLGWLRLATGLGSPVANALIPYLASYTGSGSTTTTTGGATAPTNFPPKRRRARRSVSVGLARAGETGYQLYNLENNQSVLVGTYAAGTTSATLGGLSASTSYSFQLVAYNSAGTSRLRPGCRRPPRPRHRQPRSRRSENLHAVGSSRPRRNCRGAAERRNGLFGV